MKKTLLLSLVFFALISLSFLFEDDQIQNYHSDGFESVSYSSNPPARKTGAPGESTCTSCHSGSAMSAEGLAFLTLDEGPNYIPGLTYNVTFSSPEGPRNGFELTILNGDDEMAGEFSAGGNTSTTSLSGRDYIRHNSSLGEESWSFQWTAPDEAMGTLTAYYAVAKANNNGTRFGDEIFVGSKDILMDSEVGIADEEKKSFFKAYVNSANNELNLNYTLHTDAKIVLNIQDLSGKLIEFYDFGYEASGDYSKQLSLLNKMNTGVYLVALFVGNDIYNQKLMFH